MSVQTLAHCPKCGAPGLQRPDIGSVLCPHCQFRLYLNTAAAVCALIQDEQGRLLLTVRANDPQKGSWDLPGGFVDPDETGEEAVIREVREELGLQVLATRYLGSRPNSYPFGGVTYKTLDLAYISHVERPDRAIAADDVERVLFCHPNELDLEKIGFPSIRQLVELFLRSTQYQ